MITPAFVAVLIVSGKPPVFVNDPVTTSVPPVPACQVCVAPICKSAEIVSVPLVCPAVEIPPVPKTRTFPAVAVPKVHPPADAEKSNPLIDRLASPSKGWFMIGVPVNSAVSAVRLFAGSTFQFDDVSKPEFVCPFQVRFAADAVHPLNNTSNVESRRPFITSRSSDCRRPLSTDLARVGGQLQNPLGGACDIRLDRVLFSQREFWENRESFQTRRSSIPM